MAHVARGQAGAFAPAKRSVMDKPISLSAARCKATAALAGSGAGAAAVGVGVWAVADSVVTGVIAAAVVGLASATSALAAIRVALTRR